MKIPMAVCTGRRLTHAFEKLAPVFTCSTNPGYCQSNWIFICENGSIGYYFDTEKKDYREFYRVPYPYDDHHREVLFSRISNALQGKLGDSCLNEISMAFKPLNFNDTDREATAERSHEVCTLAKKVLTSNDPKGDLKIDDSGIGVNIFPYKGDKNFGTQQFAKFLREKRGLTISENANEIAVIGDQPAPGGGDESFLNGKSGTPFTVGRLHPTNIYPLPVFDLEKNSVLQGPEGTIYLLQHLIFKNQ
jgi:hydroxymethylpyrimidine pyrophosphatase-like HAD family hydrolase